MVPHLAAFFATESALSEAGLNSNFILCRITSAIPTSPVPSNPSVLASGNAVIPLTALPTTPAFAKAVSDNVQTKTAMHTILRFIR